MYINRILPSSYNKLTFGRKLTNEEEIDYQNNAIKPALEYLGTEEVAMIVHGTCFPESKIRDLGVGSPYGAVAAQFIPFKKLHGFNSDQLGPVGVIRDAQNFSPYKSTISTRNYLFIDFEELRKDEYANILTEKDIDPIFSTQKNDDKNYAYSNFSEAFANAKYCLKLAHKNFKDKLATQKKSTTNTNINLINLKEEFDNFKNQKGAVVYKDALFDVLTDINKTNDFNKWSEPDKNLITLLEKRDEKAIERYKKIIHRSKDDYEAYIFGQFLIDKQIKKNTKLRKDLGYKYINDFLVGFSNSDYWANQELFLKDYKMGCPYGGRRNGPQTWNIPVLDPNKLFNQDDSIGPAGKYLKKKLDDALENFDNVRIDHVLGLVDPYIYDEKSVEKFDEKINMYKFKGNNISQMPHIDPEGNYKKVLSRIILPTLEEHGLTKNSPIWEDLVCETEVFKNIYHNEHNLPGITQLEYMRGEHISNPENWGLIGSHDSIPATEMIKRDWTKNSDSWNIFYLAGLLNSNPARAQKRNAYCEKIANNDSERIKAKFAELFLTCKKIQISFADFFGINKIYNVGGSENTTNWKLRLNQDYEDTYYKNLASENPTALNMPEILKIAVQAKADQNNIKLAQSTQTEPIDKNPENVDKLLANLDKYEKILKE